MNYKRLYDSIIEKALNTKRFGYTEIHHIIPRSLGGSDEESNLVKLTAREHFICHYLLTKMYEKFSYEWLKMNHAFSMMACISGLQDRYFNSRLYEATREGRSLAISFSQTGKGNSQSGTMWINNGHDNKKIKKDDFIPDGWIKGRINAHSEKSKAKLSASKKGKPGIPRSDETKAKISTSLKGRPSPKKGKPSKSLSEETKKKISLSLKGNIPWNKNIRTGARDGLSGRS